jgi:hypothetical protein
MGKPLLLLLILLLLLLLLPLPLVEESQEDEKMEGPKALDRPPDGSVSEPDLRRLLRSGRMLGGKGVLTEVEAWRKTGRDCCCGCCTVRGEGMAGDCLCD